MKQYNINQEPLTLHGLAVHEDGKFFRLPLDVIDTISDGVSQHARDTAGARVRFRTDSETLNITYRPYLTAFDGYIISRAAKTMIGVYIDGCFAGATARTNSVHSTFTYNPRPGAKKKEMQDVLIYLPMNNSIEDLNVAVDDDAQVLAPRPYKYEKPVYFYGSSITHGLAGSHPGRSYVDQVCRKLDTEYVNLGFSGSCRAEEPMRHYLAAQEMSVFVYDYDHNAPTPEYLKETHEPLFLTFREKQPDTPVIFITRPDFYKWNESDIRNRETVRATYEHALARGDKNVRFIDGESFFGYDDDRYECTVDGCHPNDRGFDKMAEGVLPVLKELLEKVYGR